MKKTALFLLFTLGLSILSSGCTKEEPKPSKQLLVYCGITMIKPMTEIAGIIEKQNDCEILITKGGSGNLLKSIRTNRVGDLYLPGSDSYIKKSLEEGIVTDTALVGFNKAAMMTTKGNPLNIPASLSSLSNSTYYVVLGNPRSGSIGSETRKILTRFGNYDKAINNAKQLTTDSKELVRVLKDGEADLVVNWYATSTWKENRDFIDVLPIADKYARKKKLILGVLSFSNHPELANSFLEYAASKKGREIFNKYGLYDIR